ncbi:hypothetical protein [Polaribacter sp. NJDZ03]|uniref:hypothetical protein n=1 Tax=Polaribacter sp. NJDZ03 TaxID=2855841 RepID=UPI001C49D749|nr:hypothetical protein [Polaribacter sp. NJDZ03]
MFTYSFLYPFNTTPSDSSYLTSFNSIRYLFSSSFNIEKEVIVMKHTSYFQLIKDISKLV